MENVILTIHLILALLLIGVVLLQRSEGGGLGMGSSGGTMTSRGAATALTRLTWIFAIAFIITSVALTLLAAKNSTGSSVIDQIGGTAPAPAPALPLTVPGSDLTLPPAPATAPLTPPRVDGGAATGDTPAPAPAGN
ncbi:MAG: preprotein translocase subunit SecG [Rhodobacterales bacterium]|nr:preprotein translocase subunit SecG [Rhodobacterales bacterium]NCO16128.1 preprotein translocase subunit SecG [Alphaproteobacteria bacterium]